MKRILIAAALALSMTTAHAATTKVNGVTIYDLHKGKWWSAFATINDNKDADVAFQCALHTEGSTTSKFYIKWTPNYGLRVQLWKKDWQLPEGVPIPFELDLFGEGFAKTLTVKNGWAVKPAGAVGTSVFGDVHEDHTADFMEKFREADRLVINFPEGDEPSWNMKSEGTRKAGEEFAKCIATMRKVLSETASSTSPIKPKATSPLGKPQAPAPTTSPIKPTGKKDDGSV